MFRTLKTMAIALAAALMMTGTASALTSVSAGGTYDITSDVAFLGNVVIDTSNPNNLGSGSYSVNFTSPVTPLLGTANASVTMVVLGAFTGLTMSWVDAITGTVLTSAPVLKGVTTLNTIFDGTNRLGQDLVFSWSSVQATGGNVGFDFDVAAVPLPAGGILLLTALGGLVLTRRRRAA